MQKCGEMCISTNRDNTHQAKLANCGTPGIQVSYADGHPTGTYWVFNPKTTKIILTQNVTFLQKSYGDFNNVENHALVTISYEGLDDEEELEMVTIISENKNDYNVVSDSKSDDKSEENFFDEDINKEVEATCKTTISVKVVHAMKKQTAFYNGDANKIVKQATKEKNTNNNLNFLIDLALESSNIKPSLDEPQRFNRARYHPNEESLIKWQEAICNEFIIMNKQKVRQKMLESHMPPNHRCIKNKWVFKIKHNGVC